MTIALFGLPQWLSSKESACNAGDAGDACSIPEGKITWRRAVQPTPVFFLAESHGQRSLEGCSPQGHKEWDTTEATEHACIAFF